jgi:uncharacterized Zn finger protein
MMPIEPERYAKIRADIMRELAAHPVRLEQPLVCPGCSNVVTVVHVAGPRGGGAIHDCWKCGQVWGYLRFERLPLPDLPDDVRVWLNEKGVKGFI